MSKNDGGAAFPSPGVILDGRQQGAYEGMTLRDYFAAKAMQAWSVGVYSPKEQVCARVAYEVDDAMLAERAK